MDRSAKLQFVFQGSIVGNTVTSKQKSLVFDSQVDHFNLITFQFLDLEDQNFSVALTVTFLLMAFLLLNLN